MATHPHRTSPSASDATETAVPVEVRARFDGRWCSGFELVEIIDLGTGIRFRIRRAGGDLLPVLFDAEDVRTPNAAAAAALARVPVAFDL